MARGLRHIEHTSTTPPQLSHIAPYSYLPATENYQYAFNTSDVASHWPEAGLYFSGRGELHGYGCRCPLGTVSGVVVVSSSPSMVETSFKRSMHTLFSCCSVCVFIFQGPRCFGLPFQPTHISPWPSRYLNTAYTQTIVELEFPPDDSSVSYDLCYKVYQQTWEQQRVKAIGKDLLKDGNVQVAIEELEPGTTYCFRLVAKASDGSKGEPGPELIIDTEAVSCTPKRRRCVIM